MTAGRLTRAQLRHRYRPIFRGGIYIPKHHLPSLWDRIEGGALLVAPGAVVAGVAASALHGGAKWVDDDVDVELIAACRPQPGLVVRREALGEGEIITVRGIRVTSPVRTAFRPGAHLTRDMAVARLDA